MEKTLKVLLGGKVEHGPTGTLTAKRLVVHSTTGIRAEPGDPGKIYPSTLLSLDHT